MNELHRKARILWLTLRIKYHRICMGSERGMTRTAKHHALATVALCRVRAEYLTPAERYEIERREGLV